MTIKTMIGPPVLTLSKGGTFLVTDQSGQISPLEAQGLFVNDTRFLSGYGLWIDGRRWERVTSAVTSHHSARICLTNVASSRFAGDPHVEADSLSLSVSRVLDEGLHEALALTNYGLCAAEVVLEIELQSDFADLFEVKDHKLRQRGDLETHWDAERTELSTKYEREDYSCCFRYQVAGASSKPTYANGRLLFKINLRPGATWQACGHMILEHGTMVHRPLCRILDDAADDLTRLAEHWVGDCTRLSTPHADLTESYQQSVEDMSALRLFERDLAPDVWVPAAGVPWFVTLFGRDSLIASLQNMPVNAKFAEGTLRILAAHQALNRDDWRDAQPGKIVHEVRHGELAHFNEVPHTRYYGTWDATPLFLMVLHQAWRWLGDRQLIEDMLPAAQRCLDWIDTCGDIDGDGFQEYQTYSAKGYENMSWKDARDAVVYSDGSQVKQPKALCEMQGYVYAAKLGAAEVFRALGAGDRAAELEIEAAELKRKFNDAFWLETEAFFAFGLDSAKQPIRTIASNAGHCLWTGIADVDKAGAVVQRLLAGDMWSGWGIRTLSAVNPAYNPFSYQLGSVWPHDNSIIASGMKRYGFSYEANQVARGIIDAAGFFQSCRLPELFAGVARQPYSFPMQYRAANAPQAWAAGSIFQLVQAILGLDADAPNRRLWVNPTLPDWLPHLELTGLRIGNASIDLRFWRDAGRSRFEVTSQEGGPLRVEEGSESSLTRAESLQPHEVVSKS